VGRIDDVSGEGMDLIHQIRQVYDNYGYETEILAASIRHPVHVVESMLIGADCCTMPPKVLWQLSKHPLTDRGLEAFLSDWEKLGAEI
jgi:transaldolase